jgi:hypothetical protein
LWVEKIINGFVRAVGTLCENYCMNEGTKYSDDKKIFLFDTNINRCVEGIAE